MTVLSDWFFRRKALGEFRQIGKLEASILQMSSTNPVELAKTALQLGDIHEAKLRWDEAKTKTPELAQQHPHSLDIILGLGDFDEAEEFARTCCKQHPREPGNFVALARVAEARGDLEAALERWKGARKRFPGYPAAYAGEAGCLFKLGRLDEAETVTGRAAKSFPEDIECQIQYCRSAENREAWPEALKRWTAFSERGRSEAAEFGIARTLDALGQRRDAEIRLEQAITDYPLNVDLQVLFAHIAMSHDDLETAAERWANVRKKFPKLHIGYLHGATLLTKIGRIEEARSVLENATERFPDQAWPSEALSRLQAENPPVSEETDSSPAAPHPEPPDEPLKPEVITTITFGNGGNASDYMLDGWSGPENGHTWTEGNAAAIALPMPRVRSCVLRIDYGAFFPPTRPFQRIRILANGIPLVSQVLTRGGEMFLWLTEEILARSVGATIHLGFELPDAASPKTYFPDINDARILGLLLRSMTLESFPDQGEKTELSGIAFDMESLGCNCEFGLVQRRCGAEPLGLLRFTNSKVSSLVAALNARFDGLGSPGPLKIEQGAQEPEWITTDSRYGFVSHTRQNAHHVPLERIEKIEARRIPRLVEKMISDLKGATKLFVYHGDEAVNADAAQPIVDAIRSYNPNNILMLVTADPSKDGTAEWHGDSLLLGYVGQLTTLYTANDFDFDTWVRLMPRAHALWKEKQAGTKS